MGHFLVILTVINLKRLFLFNRVIYIFYQLTLCQEFNIACLKEFINLKYIAFYSNHMFINNELLRLLSLIQRQSLVVNLKKHLY